MSSRGTCPVGICTRPITMSFLAGDWLHRAVASYSATFECRAPGLDAATVDRFASSSIGATPPALRIQGAGARALGTAAPLRSGLRSRAVAPSSRTAWAVRYPLKPHSNRAKS